MAARSTYYQIFWLELGFSVWSFVSISHHNEKKTQIFHNDIRITD